MPDFWLIDFEILFFSMMMMYVQVYRSEFSAFGMFVCLYVDSLLLLLLLLSLLLTLRRLWGSHLNSCAPGVATKAAIGDCDAILAVLTSWFRSVGTLSRKVL